jgi:hypothetical protein
METKDLRKLVNTFVQVVSKSSGAKYYGKLSGIRHKHNNFCLTGLIVLNRDGSFKAAPKHYNTRWFNTGSYELCQDPLKI